MTQSDVVWSSLIAAGTAYEVYTLVTARQGDTLSETTRRWFQVRTSTGRIVFTFTWLAFATWYLIHIVS